MTKGSRIIIGTPAVAGSRTIIPVVQIVAHIFRGGCFGMVNTLALVIEENGIFFFAPVLEGTTWEQISPVFGINTGEGPKIG